MAVFRLDKEGERKDINLPERISSYLPNRHYVSVFIFSDPQFIIIFFSLQ